MKISGVGRVFASQYHRRHAILFKVYALGFKVPGFGVSGFMISGSMADRQYWIRGSRVSGSGFLVSGFGFWAPGYGVRGYSGEAVYLHLQGRF